MATTIEDADGQEDRKVSGLLAIGIFLIPYIFAWFLLRRGHSTMARVIGFGWLVFCVIVFVLPRTGDTATPPATSAASATSDNMVPDMMPSAREIAEVKEGAPANPASSWAYRESKDEMRGTTTKFATTTATNQLHFGFPYGTVTPRLTVRRRPQDGLSILVQTDAQVLCNSFTESHMSVKFDDGPIRRYECTDSSDGSSDTAFILNESNFLSRLKKAKKVVIEAEFYQAGNQQMTFDVAGLEW